VKRNQKTSKNWFYIENMTEKEHKWVLLIINYFFIILLLIINQNLLNIILLLLNDFEHRIHVKIMKIHVHQYWKKVIKKYVWIIY